jgi:hypothetical protein
VICSFSATGPEVLLLLCLAAELLGDGGAEAGELHRQRDAGVGAVELLGDGEHLRDAPAAAAPLLADLLGDEVGLHPGLQDLPGVLGGLVVLGVRRDVLLGELAGLLLDVTGLRGDWSRIEKLRCVNDWASDDK